MYYLRISPTSDNMLVNYCRNCGYEETITTRVSFTTQVKQRSTQVLRRSNFVNEYTKYDPTLPRIKGPCPDGCASAAGAGPSAAGPSAAGAGTSAAGAGTSAAGAGPSAAGAGTSAASAGPSAMEQEIIVVRYDAVNLKHIYICAACNFEWNT